ncbi:hypothetical protein NKH77_00920 [Streptomyces sp. M19]
MKACLELEHTTWKMNEGSAAYDADDPNVAAAVRLMGYDLGVDNAYFHDTAQGSTTIGVRIGNDGVARSTTLDRQPRPEGRLRRPRHDLGHVLGPARGHARQDPRLSRLGRGLRPDLPRLRPPRYFDATVDLSDVTAGDYQVVMKVRNPLEDINPDAKSSASPTPSRTRTVGSASAT